MFEKKTMFDCGSFDSVHYNTSLRPSFSPIFSSIQRGDRTLCNLWRGDWTWYISFSWAYRKWKSLLFIRIPI